MSFWKGVLRFFGLAAPETPQAAPERRPSAGRAAAPKPPPGPPPTNPYEASAVMGLGPSAVRGGLFALARGGGRWNWSWQNIPPASDPHTALIDRSLVLGGHLTEEQLVALHEVGEQWRRHKNRAQYAAIKARGDADAAVEVLRRERAEVRARKRSEAEARRQTRTEEIVRRRRDDIVFLGRDVSAGLHDRRALVEALEAQGLPVLAAPADVAAAMGLTVSALRWLAFHAEAAETVHYVQFEIAKRSGGVRTLAAPMPRLAAAQQWILHEILEKLPTEEPAHGFVKGRSTRSNAVPHLGRDVVVNLDLKDFFPTITFPRVRGFFRSIGYSPAAATVLALLCTEANRKRVEYDGQRYHVAISDRALPQGACTSPALSNQIARKLDRRLAGLCRKMGWTYTRYADDLTFSAPKGQQSEIGALLSRVGRIVQSEGFALNPDKGRVQRRRGRQTVTGVVVNDKPGLPRDEVRRLRALLHNAKKHGLHSQNTAGVPDFEAHVRGRLAYLAMIDPEKGRAMLAELDALRGSS